MFLIKFIVTTFFVHGVDLLFFWFVTQTAVTSEVIVFFLHSLF